MRVDIVWRYCTADECKVLVLRNDLHVVSVDSPDTLLGRIGRMLLGNKSEVGPYYVDGPIPVTIDTAVKDTV